MDLVALVEQEFGQIRAVLAGDPGDEGFFHGLPPVAQKSIKAHRLIGLYRRRGERG